MTKAIISTNSAKGINKNLIENLSKEFGIDTIDLTTYDIPIYSIDEERKRIPQGIEELLIDLADTDKIIMSVPEHNGYLSAFLKNVLDWISRVPNKPLAGKKLIALSASPGGRGGQGAREMLEKLTSYLGIETIASHSFGDYQALESNEFVNTHLQQEVKEKLSTALA